MSINKELTRAVGGARVYRSDGTIANEADGLDEHGNRRVVLVEGSSVGVDGIENLATEAKQDALIAKDFATQTTLAAILAKIIAAPATEATVEAMRVLLAGTLKSEVAGGKATRAAVIIVSTDIAATSGITVNENTDAQVIFSADTDPVAVKLLAGVVYPYSIIKVAVGEGIVGLY